MPRNLEQLSIIKKNLEQKYKTSIELMNLGFEHNNHAHKNNGAYLAGYVLELFVKIALGCSRDKMKSKDELLTKKDHFHVHHIDGKQSGFKNAKHEILKNPGLIELFNMPKVDTLKLNQHNVNTFRYDPEYSVKNYFIDITTPDRDQKAQIDSLSEQDCKDQISQELDYLLKESNLLRRKYPHLFLN